MKRILCVILTVLLLCSLSLPAAAAAKAVTMTLDAVEGTVNVKNAAGKTQSVHSGLRLYSGYAVSTDAASYAYIGLDDTKVIKLDASSEVTVQKSGKKLEILLSSGSLIFDVSEPLAGGESLNIRTSTMVTGVRGTAAEISVKSLTIDFSGWTLKEAGGRRVYTAPDGIQSVEVDENGAVFYSNETAKTPVRRGTSETAGTIASESEKTAEELEGSLSIQHTTVKLVSGILEIEPRGMFSEMGTVVLHEGEQVSSLNAFVPEDLPLEDLSGSSLTFLEEDPSLQDRILDGDVYTEEELRETLDEADEILAEEQAGAAEKQAEIDAVAKETEQASDQVFSDSIGAVVDVAVSHRITFTAGAGYEWLDSNGLPITSAVVPDGEDFTFGIRIRDGYVLKEVPYPDVYAAVGDQGQQLLPRNTDASYTVEALTEDCTVSADELNILQDDTILVLPLTATWTDVQAALNAVYDSSYTTIILSSDMDEMPALFGTFVNLSAGQTLILRPGASLTMLDDAGYNPDFENAGTIVIESGAEFTVNGIMVSSGTVNDFGTMNINGTLNNSGTVSVSVGGTLNNSQTVQQTGTGTIIVNGLLHNAGVISDGDITVALGATMENDIGASVFGSNVTNNGTFINCRFDGNTFINGSIGFAANGDAGFYNNGVFEYYDDPGTDLDDFSFPAEFVDGPDGVRANRYGG